MRLGHLDNGHLSDMNKKTLQQVMQILSEAHPSNSSNDFSISVHNSMWDDIDYNRIVIFSNLSTKSFVETTLRLFLSIAEILPVHISLGCRHGVPVVEFT